MMYCEFIDISEYGENYITFTEYHDYIEPIYMECDMSKQDKLAIAFSDEEPVELLDRIAKIDFEARKLVYQYLKLMLTI